jgi:hypothetical protein
MVESCGVEERGRFPYCISGFLSLVRFPYSWSWWPYCISRGVGVGGEEVRFSYEIS